MSIVRILELINRALVNGILLQWGESGTENEEQETENEMKSMGEDKWEGMKRQRSEKMNCLKKGYFYIRIQDSFIFFIFLNLYLSRRVI